MMRGRLTAEQCVWIIPDSLYRKTAMTHTPPRTFSNLLERLKQDASSTRNQGDRLEYFVQEFLRTDPVQSAQFKNVWLWSDWPGNNGERDNGIDLVAERHDGTLVAIQSKFFGENTEISQASISSFVARVRSGRFSSGILVSTTDRISSTAENLMGENPDIPILHLDYSYFSSAAIDWDSYLRNKEERGQAALSRAPQKELRDHQQKAISKVLEGFESADRGKLIMACGTGKTFTALKLAEAFSERSEDSHTTVLFMVPSLALMSQSIVEFSAECSLPLRIFAVCSDTKVGRAKTSDDMPPENIADLKIPATTDGATLFAGWEKSEIDEGLTVVFATYQSIAAVTEAQKLGLPDFDLIICDEAHRTTGATLVGQSESHFVRIHDNAHVSGAKRLYMTATPRIYNENAKSSASEKDAVLVSMDDIEIYGETFHTVNFGEAISLGLLTDYKVLVFGVSEEQVSAGFQGILADQNRELKVDDVAKLVGAYNALAKRNVNDSTHDFGADPFPMKRAVAFSRSIKDSKKITTDFPHVADQIRDLDNEDPTDDLSIEVKHIDGGFGALERGKLLDWLKEDVTSETPNCRILSNARCLTEGVDVPNLDAVMFLNPRNSMVDIIQAVGRVMRKAPGKKYGYIVLPVVVPAGATAESSLDSNESYKTIWKVVQALRAHDERLGNDLELARLENRNPQNIIVDFVDLAPASSGQKNSIGAPADDEDSASAGGIPDEWVQGAFTFPVEEWKQAINTKVVEKCGDRFYWADWSKDIADIARKNIELIRGMLASAEDGAPVVLAFEQFVADLQVMLNPTIDEGQAIELLAQHLITQPIFAAMFAGHRFTMENPVSQAMQAILEILNENAAFEREMEGLEKFYAGVEARVAEVNSAAAKQNIIKELYDHFFRVAFPKTADRLGIVFTPVEVVDYILRSADVALQKHFGKRLSDRGVSILEPFAGTGTFITRLLQLGLIRTEDLVYKFTREIYANELVLLSYYIAAINVESVFAEVASERGLELDYVPFEGMVLTDTFQLTESASQLSNESVFAANSLRAQKELDAGIQVIVMNPPYSAGQESANDNNQNLKYPALDESIAATYAAKSTGTNLNSLYDSYIRAIRWATDRIDGNGVIAFVSNGSFIDGNAADGLRKSLVEEFSDIYVFNLRGNQRTSGETSRREGGKIFGSGSRTPVAICVLVKQTGHSQPATLHYHDIGDYLTRTEKLDLIEGFGSINGTDWEVIEPNEAGDWINQRDERYDAFQPLGDKKTKGKAETPGVFQWYSRGLATSRDAWCYNHSREKLTATIKGMIDFYNQQLSQAEPDYDATKISWNRQLLKDRERAVKHKFKGESVCISFYRPFDKQIAYFDRSMNDMIYQLPKLFPTPGHQNLVFSVSGVGSNKGFSLVLTDCVPDLQVNFNSQVFSLYYYEPVPEDELALSVGDDVVVDGYYRRDNITDATLKTYRAFYEDASITKEDIFYYIYALLHHPVYRETYRADLMKMLPRIPKVEGFSDYARIGRELAELHLTYESVAPYSLTEIEAGFAPSDLEAQYDYYRVQKLKFGRGKDKSTIIVNSNLTLEGIPEEAYGYEVNGRSAIEWIIDRYQVKTDKKSQITNDPNDWCREVGNPRYIVDLIKRIVTVSLETNSLVEALPELNILD